MDAESDLSVIVIGAGITGLGAAYHLRANGIPYQILEQNDDLGGIWYTQRWHGARCDSDFVKYSFSFKPYLSRKCLEGREQIHQYLRSVAEEFHLLERIHFNTRVITVMFDTEIKKWTVHTTRGIFHASFLINGNGYFSEPYMPAIRNADKFRGEIIHTFYLDASRTFLNKHVVLVGSGATAICCAPELSCVSKSLVLLQRSPSYIYEIDNKASRVTLACQSVYRIGVHWPLRLLRYYLQCRDDLIFVGLRKFPRLGRWIFRCHWHGTIGKETLRRHFSPRYNPWEQRIPVAIGLKEKIRNKKVIIRTGEIDHFTDSAMVLKGGARLTCDACVLATGFHLNFLKFDMYVGGTKVRLDGVNFYKGVMMGAVPNYFQPVGVWHSAWTWRSESVTRFAIKIIAYMKKNGFRSVCIDRKEVDCTPAIRPNYILRSLEHMPRLYGTLELPAIDNLISYWFQPRKFNFS